MPAKISFRRPQCMLALIVTVFVLRGLLAITIVPPWQHPDEPQHFEFVHILAQQEQFDLSERTDVDLERRILSSMSSYGWWGHYGEIEPSPLPVKFSEVSEHIYGVGTSPPAYYLLGAMVLRLAQPDGLVAQYYVLRWMALALSVLTMVCIWAGSRRLFGVPVAVGATLLAALQPQFLLMSTSVNPDVLVNLCGAVVWWLGARLLSGGSVVWSTVGMVCAAVIGILTKRVAAPLALMLVVIPLVAFWFGRFDTRRSVGVFFGALTGGMLLVGLAAVFWFRDEMLRVQEYWGHLLTFSWSDRAGEWPFFQEFSAGLSDSFWLQAGWLRYPAPQAWLLTTQLLTIGAFTGYFVGVSRSGMVRWRAGLVLAGTLASIQIASVYVGVYMNGFGPQGRYLFPVMGPLMVLLWTGIHSWWPQRVWPLIGAGVLFVMFVLDAISWFEVLIPAYGG